MDFPKELRYSTDHEWVSIKDDIATIGITEFAQSELGDIVFLELPDSGQAFKTGEVFGNVEAVKTVSDLFMPLSGQVIQINPSLASEPELLNEDPYGEGWIMQIKGFSVSEFEALLSADQYQSQVG
ncbi:glycine cleavage system protein GcvH [Dyadobacter psychrotolerans]|uniref:Glycine cleavage system H protein n=1 Tax=Dyadobacter psychrotolerans TaxID=2541721 RepID=A0A4R5DC19_9BACT|nr:glycine cleavage system protein GcvH [Dyadobacter psychrotolerans]TDE09361.1 glycine cleavage system protein GcvH [Dyadobacter psychrotolerans]